MDSDYNDILPDIIVSHYNGLFKLTNKKTCDLDKRKLFLEWLKIKSFESIGKNSIYLNSVQHDIVYSCMKRPNENGMEVNFLFYNGFVVGIENCKLSVDNRMICMIEFFKISKSRNISSISYLRVDTLSKRQSYDILSNICKIKNVTPEKYSEMKYYTKYLCRQYAGLSIVFWGRK